jgi:alpha-N-arabinofuranosidase
MKTQNIITAFSFLLGVYATPVEAQQPLHFTVKANEVKAAVSPNMWGIFFEDINLSADGGIYAELVKNRSFEFSTPLMGWDIPKEVAANGQVLVINRAATNPANPRFARVTVPGPLNFSLSNEGFRGMGIKAGERYNFSVYARQEGSTPVKLKVTLLDESGQAIGSTTIDLLLIAGSNIKAASPLRLLRPGQRCRCSLPVRVL